MKILNVGYGSVNCYLLVTEKAKFLIDVGWPGGMRELKLSFAGAGLSVKDVTHVLVTHYHIDHGGIAQEMKDKGAKLVVMESQREHLNDQKKFIKPPIVFHEIKTEGNVDLAFRASRAFLKTLDIEGKIVPTPSHSGDHVTLVLSEGIAFTGDLAQESGAAEGSDTRKDWLKLRAMKVRRVYPAHGMPYDLA